MTLWQMFKAGGLTLYVLILCSIASLAIIVERILYFRARTKVPRGELMDRVRVELKAGNFKKAADIARASATCNGEVVAVGLGFQGASPEVIGNAMARAIVVETAKLERWTTIVGTIGSTAVYIGLFGTVLGIMRAFSDIASSNFGGINVVINGIAEALICTAAGLAVAVPAVVAHHFFLKKIDHCVSEMELCASETQDMLRVE